jgi:hypothetical protein
VSASPAASSESSEVLWRLEIGTRVELSDALASATASRLKAVLGLRPTGLRTRKLYHLDLGLDAGEAGQVLAALVDPISEEGALGCLPDPAGALVLSVGYRPGVTDSVGRSVLRAAEDRLGRPLAGQVFTSTMYVFTGLQRAEVEAAARELHNPLIQRVRIEACPPHSPRAPLLDVPHAGTSTVPGVMAVALGAADDAMLEQISRAGMLALSLPEMQAIRDHFRSLGRDPSDAELECIAQTWSEHCKHKIFAAPITYTDPRGETREIERGLFKEYIRGATEAVAARRVEAGIDPAGQPFLVSVFHDNAGVVRFSPADHLVYKVETHNSPSALDPYGGAMTGIVGVNRDSLATGLGAELLTNVWGYCFGEPDHSAPLPPGLMHPRRIREGVHQGVIDGGNQSGIPYSRGFELFDARYAGKPLVYCGTVAVMPALTCGPADGGQAHCRRGPGGHARRPHRQGRDPRRDLLERRARRVLAGPGGADRRPDHAEDDGRLPARGPRARALLGHHRQRRRRPVEQRRRDGRRDRRGPHRPRARAAQVPGPRPVGDPNLRGPGAHDPGCPQGQHRGIPGAARRREVEASVLGEFTDSGRLVVTHGETMVCDLELAFLHDGLPRWPLRARWSPPARALSERRGRAPRRWPTMVSLRPCSRCCGARTCARTRRSPAATTTRSRGCRSLSRGSACVRTCRRRRR